MNTVFCCYIEAYLFHIKAIIRVVDGNIKGLFGMFRKKEKNHIVLNFNQFQCLAFGRVNINETL